MLAGSPSEDNAGQGPGESGADNSPLATDEEEEEDEEEEPTGDDDTPATSLPDVIDDNSDDVAAAAAAVAPANDSLGDDAAASRPADPAENPPSKSLLESHSVVSPTPSASTPPSHTPSPPPPSRSCLQSHNGRTFVWLQYDLIVSSGIEFCNKSINPSVVFVCLTARGDKPYQTAGQQCRPFFLLFFF